MGPDRVPALPPELPGLLGVLVVDGGLALATIGIVLPEPSLAVAGLVVFAAGLLLPVRATRLPDSGGALDAIVPRYQFGEHHQILVDAPPERVFSAVRATTARDIRFFRLLTWLRSPRLGSRTESILNPAPDEPILDVAIRSGFVLLHEQPPSEIVVGTIVCCGSRLPSTAEEFHAREGSVVRAVMGFHAVAAGEGGTRLLTQTRVHASDAKGERRFAAYWRLIYPGSAFIRRMWLRAIRERAESREVPPTPDGSGAGP